MPSTLVCGSRRRQPISAPLLTSESHACKFTRMSTSVVLELDQDLPLRRGRESSGKSLRQVAEILGVHRSYLSRVERHQAPASLRVLSGLSGIVGGDAVARYLEVYGSKRGPR